MTGANPSSRSAIRLDQFLKIQGLVATGGQAKIMIQSGEVLVNGRIETRRGRQLVTGDVITVGDHEFRYGAKEE
ncbi:MAG: RNA-binding S4 domain-containing protein [Pirellulaceae bacterium]